MKKLILCMFFTAMFFPGLLFSQYIQQGPKLVGTGFVGAGEQGYSVGLSGDGNTAIVGAPHDNGNNGAAWIYIKSGGTWTQQGTKLVGSGAIGAAWQGTSVALSADGNTFIIGGDYDNSNTGAAWVFTRSGGVWTQQAKLVGTGGVGISQMGYEVAISGDGNTAILGGYPDNNFTGAAWIFIRSGTTWTQQGPKLIGTGTAGAASQGIDVALSYDGNTALSGGWTDSTSIGATWVFTRTGGMWTQQGPKLVGTGSVGQSHQGYRVSLSANGITAVIGGYTDNNNGAVWVFKKMAGIWSQQGPKLVGSGGVGNSGQGQSARIDSNGTTLVFGGPYDSSSAGALWVFKLVSNVWTQQGPKFIGSGAVGAVVYQGTSMCISNDGNTIIESGLGDNNHIGAAWVFISITSGIVKINSNVPLSPYLSQNYPNPFNPSTKIKFDIPALTKGEFVKLKIYDILGRESAVLVNEQLKAGSYEAEWNASNFGSGIYFYNLEIGETVITKRMVLVK